MSTRVVRAIGLVGLLSLALAFFAGCRRQDKPIEAGRLDTVDADFIAGWARDKKTPGTPVRVDIYDGETLLASVLADQFREDLKSAGVGDGNFGFSYATPPRMKDGRPHTVRAKISGIGYELPGSPKVVTLKPPSR